MEFDLDKMYCGLIRRGDIFVCEWENKNMTVVVLQDRVLNESLSTVICALLTPFIKGEKLFPNEVLLSKSETGLGKKAICQLHKIYTIDRRAMQAKKGEAGEKKLEEILTALNNNLGRFRDMPTEFGGLVSTAKP